MEEIAAIGTAPSDASLMQQIVDTPFVQDQESLKKPLGIFMTAGMVVGAVGALGALLYFLL